VLVLRDVTNEREVQARAQEQERLAAIGQLAAGIAHDFNNILATIVLYAQMSARSPELPPKVRERMETINQQAKRGSDLIQQILDFSRSAMLERRGMDLAAFLNEQVEILRRTLPSSIEITLSCENGDMIIHADPTRIQQAVMNLAVNARDAMPRGGRLHFALSRRRVGPTSDKTPPGMVPGDVVLLRVTDSGHGIPSDVLPHIFEPFFTTKPAGTGVGLGLSQVWGIIKQHEGHISVETGSREGTSILIYFPAAMTIDDPEHSEEGELVRQGHSQRVLVVEDNPLVRKSLVEALDLLGYRATAASNGREAVAIYQAELDDPPPLAGDRIAVVLTDQVMPEMGGTELLQTLQGMGWKGPAILLTGHSMQQDAREHGAIVSLQKPVNLERLSEALTRALEK
jgi:nitrogen-specific signal transduction histidine kinase/ActR/RegA family two-component response regulator